MNNNIFETILILIVHSQPSAGSNDLCPGRWRHVKHSENYVNFKDDRVAAFTLQHFIFLFSLSPIFFFFGFVISLFFLGFANFFTSFLFLSLSFLFLVLSARLRFFLCIPTPPRLHKPFLFVFLYRGFPIRLMKDPARQAPPSLTIMKLWDVVFNRGLLACSSYL